VEKRRPSLALDSFRRVCGSPLTLAITRTALSDALELGFDRFGISEVVRTMKPSHFYKSMTAFADHRRWQDVYHVPCGDVVLYIKFADDAVTEFTLLSFKER
jgi:motility quorum-sensing regulator/GCU-specific mRNA interferase toxin